ncbi:DUF551 domain-containing protein [Enterobacter hormaechei]|nr:DUF551 domain-containing protein [Enterobacter hormaechei]ELW9370253.1 DUF551 domain-containing protein [Enterobacter hormaechei]
MSTITKQWLQQKIAEMEEHRDLFPGDLDDDHGSVLAAFRIALASLEAEAVAYIFKHPAGRLFWALTDESNKGQSDVMPVYTAPPAPISVPAAMEMDDDFDSSFEHGKAVGWNAYRAAMLQGAEPAQEWIPCSERMPEQFKAILVFNEYGEVWSGAYDRYWNFYCDNELVECVTHWMPLPAAPQQEA